MMYFITPIFARDGVLPMEFSLFLLGMPLFLTEGTLQIVSILFTCYRCGKLTYSFACWQGLELLVIIVELSIKRGSSIIHLLLSYATTTEITLFKDDISYFPNIKLALDRILH